MDRNTATQSVERVKQYLLSYPTSQVRKFIWTPTWWDLPLVIVLLYIAINEGSFAVIIRAVALIVLIQAAIDALFLIAALLVASTEKG